MSSCKCKNDSKIRDTREDPGRKMDSLGAAAWGHCLPLGGGLGSPRSQKVSLLHIRPIMASLMIACLALPQKYKTSILGMQRNFCKKNLKPTDPKKRGEKRKKQDGLMSTKIEIQMYYISNLPLDITVGEFTQLTSKFCIIMRDRQKNL